VYLMVTAMWKELESVKLVLLRMQCGQALEVR
jgi:hypothetical protein